MKSVSTNLKPYLNTNNTFIVSVSGGVDSMALLDYLYTNNFNIVVVHFNHLTRPETAKEQSLVQSYCESRLIPFYSFELSISKSNFHHKAHQLRSHYLESIAKLRKTPYIITAHHLNDLFETILINQTRGGHLLSYAGMQVAKEKGQFIYLKPCLYINKQTLVNYAKDNNVSYLEDNSNETHAYLRNRYRHAVIPLIHQENDNLDEQIINYHNQVTKAHEFIRDITKNVIKNKNEISLSSFVKQKDVIQEDLLAYLFEMNNITFNYRTILQIKKMILNDKPNNSFKISANLHFIKAYDRLYIDKKEKPTNEPIILKNGINEIENVSIFTLLVKTPANPTQFTKLCYNKLAFPLVLRRRENGDRLSFNYGTKKLKDFLIDQKIPTNLRDTIWIVVDQNNQIIWIPNFYLNETLGNENELYMHMSEV